ncbi:TRAF-interacting protein [Temnothorax longispinosus]|uniref:TRAF-interacting protein n=1 Tax=Temnothorax longispinosus TaxID=300112 RepID=A0A4S2JDZ4_9HYME|nr:TRAF-interacting protein [Temnothorax longispinosus]
MNILCAICNDLLVPSDDVFRTPCGHVFHFACLTQWLERSKTCPQCQVRTTEQTIGRIIFNFSNSDSIEEEAALLQNRNENLIFQLKLRDEELNKLAQETEKLATQREDLKQEVRDLKSEINAILALEEQIENKQERE